MQNVTSRQNPRLKEAARLIASSRDRRKAGKCVLEGEHLVAAYAQRHGAPESIVVTNEALAHPSVHALALRYAERVLVVTPKLLSELTVLPAGVGMLAVVSALQPEKTAPAAADFCLLLDDIQDPGSRRRQAGLDVEALRLRLVAQGTARGAGRAFLPRHLRGCRSRGMGGGLSIVGR